MSRQVLMTISDFYATTGTVVPKDAWDKAQIVGSILASVVVALLGAYFTWLYNRQQQRIEDRRRAEDAAAAKAREAGEREAQLRAAQLNESEIMVRRVQAVQSLLPDLKSGVQRDRRAALLAIQALGDDDFAADLARIYGGPAGVSALASLSLGGNAGKTDDRASVLLSGLTTRLRHSVARIGLDEGMMTGGSGFSVQPDRVLTAGHVIGPAREGVLQMGQSRTTYPWQLIGYSEGHELALLECRGAPMVPLLLASSSPGVEEDILVVGWDPGRRRWVANPGIVLGPPHQADPHGQIWLMPAEIGSVPGFSGAPVVNSSLEVVAMHYAKFPQTNDADKRGLAHMLSLQTLRSFLDGSLSAGKTVDPGPPV